MRDVELLEHLERLSQRGELDPTERLALRRASEQLRRQAREAQARTLPPGSWDTLMDAAAPTSPAPAHPSGPYQDLGLLGVGGMGEVRRVLDPALNRHVALKVLRAELGGDARAVARFVEEAQVSAQLDHPGVLPVHTLGELPDGRLYFTMKEVRGQTLRQVFRELRGDGPADNPRGWTLRRVVEVLRKVCEAVAYAHSQGVVHRDIKPDNVMVGSFGEVLVLDWGLARVRGAAPGQGVRTTSVDAPGLTRDGVVAGTPTYMSPEQAAGETRRIGPASDVYALGAVLFELLSGSAPFQGASSQEVLERVLRGERSVSLRGRGLPEPLVACCERAMSAAPAQRQPNAMALVHEITDWLEGAQRRERALAQVEESDRLAEHARALSQLAEQHRELAEQALEGVPSWAPVADKRDGWELADQARALELKAQLAELEGQRCLQGALQHEPELPEAHRRLADHHHARHQRAEREGDALQMVAHEAALRAHDGVQQRYADYLRGEGRLSVASATPGATATLHRYVLQDRRLVPRLERDLGALPIHELALPVGSWLVVLSAPDHDSLPVPVHIRRGEHCHGRPPGASQTLPLTLPASLPADQVCVPAGWFQAGAGPEVFQSLPPQTVWLDGFIMQRHPVTNRQYIAFLDDLVVQGREEEALRRAPRERAGSVSHQGALIYGRDAEGRFHLRPDTDGDCWGEDWPVLMVSWRCASAYARWFAARSGQPWRLPFELEWEKAARGVDGRLYPWGEHLDGSWACMKLSHRGRPLPTSVNDFPEDVSPYGVRGLAGNARDWCQEPFTRDGPALVNGRMASMVVETAPDPDQPRVFRGGSWGDQGRCRAPVRYSAMPATRLVYTSFRLVRPWPDGE